MPRTTRRTVSHELKPPLTSLRMAVYLLLEPNLGQVAPAQRNCWRPRGTMPTACCASSDDLLDLSRFEGGATALNRTSEPVDQLLAALAAERKPNHRKRLVNG